MLQVLNNFIKVNGSSEGGNFFLGSRYSYAETLTTPFVQRALVALPHFHKYDLVKSAKDHGLDRLLAWIEVRLYGQMFEEHLSTWLCVLGACILESITYVA